MPIKLSKLFKVFIVITILLLAIGFAFGKPDQEPIENYFLGSKNRQEDRVEDPQHSRRVEDLIQKEAPKLAGRWAIAVKNLSTGKTYLYKQNEIFAAASLYKLAVMWATFAALEEDRLSGNNIFTGDKKALDEKLKSMITVSDNDSATLLAEQLGWQNIDALMEKEGLGGLNLIEKDAPSTTAEAVLSLLERIYNNTAVSQEASKKMQDLLFGQKINDRIPRYLPEGTKVGHKTGELGSVKHDAGIVLGQKSHYIFVFLSETPAPGDAAETIASFSKKIFDGLEK